MFENELLPYMLAIGVTEDEFWHLTLRQMKIRQKAYEIKMRMQDEQAWAFCGNYVFSAVSTAVDHCLNGRKARTEYIGSPMLRKYSDDEENSNSESREEVAIFEMQQRINALRAQGLPESPI